MAFIVVSSWIPRSHTHVYEIGGKLGKVELDVESVEIEGSLSFKITSRNGRVIKASLNPFGLFTFTSEVKEDELSEKSVKSFKEEVANLLLEDIFGATQQVTYQQIKDGILPLSFHASVFSESCVPEGVEPLNVGGRTLYYNPEGLYSADSDIYVCGKPDKTLSASTNYFSYVVLTSSYMNAMVEEMSRNYKKTLEVEEKLEKSEFEAIGELMYSLGWLRKDCSERYGKLMQAVKNFEHAEGVFRKESFTKEQAQLSEALKVSEGFERLGHDSDYLLPLWSDVLIKNLENLDFMMNARFELQQSVETMNEEKEMKLLQVIFLIGVIASILTLGAMPGAKITLYNPDGSLAATGNMVSFDLGDLINFGIAAIIFSIVFFVLFNYIYGKIAHLISEKKAHEGEIKS